MSEATRWIGYAAIVLLAAGGAAVPSLVLLDRESTVRRRLGRYQAGLDADLGFLRSRWTGARVTAAQGVAAVALGGLSVAVSTWVPLLALPPVAVVPRLALMWMRTKRVSAIDGQLDGWLVVLANALKASPSLGEALASTARLVQPPMSDELDLTLKEYQLGTPLDEALGNMGDRVRSRSVTGAVVTLRVARNTGGDLPSTLERAAATLREIARLEGVVRTKTAEGRAQAVVVSIIPAPLIAAIQLMSPGYLQPLASTVTGHLVIGAAGLLWVAAIALAVRITRVDV